MGNFQCGALTIGWLHILILVNESNIGYSKTGHYGYFKLAYSTIDLPYTFNVFSFTFYVLLTSTTKN